MKKAAHQPPKILFQVIVLPPTVEGIQDVRNNDAVAMFYMFQRPIVGKKSKYYFLSKISLNNSITCFESLSFAVFIMNLATVSISARSFSDFRSYMDFSSIMHKKIVARNEKNGVSGKFQPACQIATICTQSIMDITNIKL